MKRVVIKVVALLLCLLVAVVTDAQVLTDYVAQRKKEVAEAERVERRQYEQACAAGTLDALMEYKRQYPKGKYAKDVTNRIWDFDIWNEAKQANTIGAYNRYLEKSRYKSFEAQANEAIAELRSVEAWNKIGSAASVSEYEAFVARYPHSSMAPVAWRKIHEDRGVKYFKKGYYDRALSVFDSLGGRKVLSDGGKSIYDSCFVEVTYRRLRYNQLTEIELISFLYRFPDSKYADAVSNAIALKKAKSLTMFSSTESENEVLGYARDEDTRRSVMAYIKENRRAYRDHKKALRREDGSLVSLGVEFVDAGGAIGDFGSYSYYNFGLGLKFGNYRAPVQFELGVKPGYVWRSGTYGRKEDCGHYPLFARLKVNLCDGGNRSKFFAEATGYWHLKTDDCVEGRYSLSGGVGWSWRHCDLAFLFKTSPQGRNSQYPVSLGLSFRCYL